MKTRAILAILASALFGFGAHAHGPAKGPNGGPQVDAGDYHVELVTKGRALTVYIRDGNEKDVPAEGAKATAILVVAGKPQRIELKPGGSNTLTGEAGVELPATPKGAVQITLPGGKTAQAKFE